MAKYTFNGLDKALKDARNGSLKKVVLTGEPVKKQDKKNKPK